MKVMVSGSSSGIGRALTEMLLARGDSVIGLARAHHKFVPGIDRYHPVTIDFSQIDRLEASLKSVLREHDDVDALVACAGYGQFAELEQFSVAQIERLMMVNFVSQAALVKCVLPLLKTRRGKIIVLGSEAALNGARKGSIYCASKFALRGFCQSLRKECWGDHVAVSLVNPGLVKTPFFDALPFEPEDAQEHAISVDQVANTLAQLLALNNDCVFEEINLQPMRSAIKFKRKIPEK